MTTPAAPDLLESVHFDAEGYLTNPADWTPGLAEAIAHQLGITLNERHWLVINFARNEVARTGESPSLRRITKQSGVDTKELYQLFPGGPAKVAAKIAGLKKPTGCI